MSAPNRASFATLLATVALTFAAHAVSAQPQLTTVVASDAASIRAWDTRVDAMLRSGELQREISATVQNNGIFLSFCRACQPGTAADDAGHCAVL